MSTTEPPTRIRLTKRDVEVFALVPELCSECEEREGTHAVTIDLRGVGQRITVEPKLCERCANEFANDLRATLADEDQP